MIGRASLRFGVAYALLAILVAGALSACAATQDVRTDGVPATGSGAALTPGLYDTAEGGVRAVGTLEYRDVEGGFWAVVGSATGQPDPEPVIAVIVNSDRLAVPIEALSGQVVVVTGRRVEGASIRMSGPEIEADDIAAWDEHATPRP